MLAETTIAIVLGASEFPQAPNLSAPASFRNSAGAVLEYLKVPGGLNLPNTNVLDLFNSDLPPNDQISSITKFLRSRKDATDLLVYYVGHGGFSDDDYFLAIRRTEEGNEGVSSCRIRDLARTVKRDGAQLRQYLILDCCFAASAIEAFMGPPLDAATKKTLAEFPRKGTALLCSSSAENVSMAPPGEPYTMFSNGLLQILREGDAKMPPTLNLEDVGNGVRAFINERYPNDAVRPEVHIPRQTEGSVATIPMFPNAAFAANATDRRMASMETALSTLTNRLDELAERIESHAFHSPQETDSLSRKRDPLDMEASQTGIVWLMISLVGAGGAIALTPMTISHFNAAVSTIPSSSAYLTWSALYLLECLMAFVFIMTLLSGVVPRWRAQPSVASMPSGTRRRRVLGGMWVGSPWFEAGGIVAIVGATALSFQTYIPTPIATFIRLMLGSRQ